MSRSAKFRRHPLAFAAAAALLAITAPQGSLAGVGWGTTTNPANASTNAKMRTFWANSPSGLFPAAACFDPATGAPLAPVAGGPCDAGGNANGAGLRKFVDSLAGFGAAGANNLGNYVPVAAPDTTTYAGSDYYEIAVVEYRQKMHSDMPGTGTLLRGYVQIDPAATDAAAGLANLAVAPAGSKGVPLVNADGKPAMISRPDSASATGFRSVQAYGVDNPHYLGPVIQATQGRATRLKLYNALPVGRADALGKNGDIALPVDETLPGAGYGPQGGVKYSQNRVMIHLHGGDNPWISDGSPHQWITPAGEADAANPNSVAGHAAAKGVAAAPLLRGPGAYNVPDMADPGPGAMTYYYPNGLSARMMWYHDHSFGLTRINVYEGLASGYFLTDAKEQALKVPGGPLDLPEVPLVIQDKTFVPANIATQDAKWDSKYWGGPGDLWFGHVYETNQDPKSLDGTNPVGRWDWGPFFWPVFPSAMDLPTGEHKIFGTLANGLANAAADPTSPFYVAGPAKSWTNAQTAGTLDGPSAFGLTEVTLTPETFNDTPVVNGVAYPTVTVDPKAYRFRILNASNDRMLNLGLYVAADANTMDPNNPMVSLPAPVTGAIGQPQLCDGSQAATANCSEVRMVPFTSPNGPTSTTFTCPPSGLTPVSASYPHAFPCAGGGFGTGWGQADNRPGGVPDPTTAGPNMHLIGNEGGFLAVPVDVPSTPINYEYNKRSVTVLNVLERGVFVGAAERADVVVDFSAYAGKTLILYNDAPAPMPAGDPRLEYYTGGGDQTGAGGHSNTLPGYGPNMRTVMQIKVAANPPAAAYNFAGLDSALKANYAAGQQPQPIVAQTAYQPTFGAAAPYNADVFARIYTGAIYLGNYQPLSFTTTGPLTYTPAPGAGPIAYPPTAANPAGVTLANAKCGTAAACQAEVNAIKANGTLTVAAGTPITAYVENKTIQELFDPTWGRMNATLGVELPFVSALTQTTIPLGYVDPATETVADGETQFWKITHNGVDSHPVHFHLVNVQVVNRIGWDGTVKPPYWNEIGWNETVIMNPLEDIVVAVRSRKPQTPFGLMHSYRANDPSQPLGTAAGFTQVNPITGNPATVVNSLSDFINEYVWHCHILGHEENDFMRAVVFDPKDVAPDAPLAVNVAATVGGNIALQWADPTPAGGVDAANVPTLGNAKNEIGFRVERAQLTNGVAGAYTSLGTTRTYPGAAFTARVNTLANVTTFTDTTPLVNADASYRVVAVNAKGESASAAVTLIGPVAAPTNLAVTGDTATSISLSWKDNASNETAYVVSYTPPGTNGIGSVTLPANSTATTVGSLANNTAYSFSVTAQNATSSATVGPVSGTTAPIAVSGLAASTAAGAAAGTANVTLNWTNGNNNLGTLASVVVSGTYTDPATNAAVAIAPQTFTGVAITAAGAATVAGLPAAVAYSLTVTVNGAGGSAAATASGTTGGFALAAASQPVVQLVSGVTANLNGTADYQLAFTDNSRNETGYKYEVCYGLVTQCVTAGAVTTALPTNGGTPNTWYDVSTKFAAASSTTPVGAPANYSVRLAAVPTISGNQSGSGANYFFRVTPLNTTGTLTTPGPVSPVSAFVDVASRVGFAAPANVTGASNAAGQLTVSWTDVANNNASDTVQYRLARTLNTLVVPAGGGGAGYTTAPTVTLSAPNLPGGVQATAVAIIGTNPANAATYQKVTGYTIINRGSGYTAAPTVTLSAPQVAGGVLARGTATITAAPAWTTPAAANVTATNGLSTSATISGLTTGGAYVFQVRANPAGNSTGGGATPSAYVGDTQVVIVK